MNDRYGNAFLRVEHDTLGNLVSSEVFDKAGSKVTGTDGWQRFEATCDERANRIEEKYFNAPGGRADCKKCAASRA